MQPFQIRYRDANYDHTAPVPSVGGFRSTPLRVPRGTSKAQPSISSSLLLLAVLLLIAVYVYRKRREIAAHTRVVFTHLPFTTPIEQETTSDRLLHIDPAIAKRAFSGQLRNLTPCTNDACTDYANLAVEVKNVHTSAVREFALTTPRALFMVWAPWCGYCELFMPEFVNASLESTIPFVLVNVELVTPSLFDKNGGIFEVTGFPAFVLYENQDHGPPRITPLSVRPSREALLALAGTN